MDIFNSSLAERLAREHVDRLVGAIESALYPFKTGGVTIWYEDNLDTFRQILVTVEVKTLGRLRLRFDKADLLTSYLEPIEIIAAEVYAQIKNRQATEIDNPNIILGEE